MIPKPSLEAPVLLTSAHEVSGFDCGSEALNIYLKRFALTNNQNGSARTYVALRGRCVAGYYTLAAGSVSKSESSPRVAKGLANHPVPVILLARLARHNEERAAGLGSALLKDALLRIVRAADIIGARAVLAHAKDERAREFYILHGFSAFGGPANGFRRGTWLPAARRTTDPFHVMLLVKDIKKTLGL